MNTKFKSHLEKNFIEFVESEIVQVMKEKQIAILPFNRHLTDESAFTHTIGKSFTTEEERIMAICLFIDYDHPNAQSYIGILLESELSQCSSAFLQKICCGNKPIYYVKSKALDDLMDNHFGLVDSVFSPLDTWSVIYDVVNNFLEKEKNKE